MAEGGVKAWEPHQVQNPLAFSDEEEEDLLDFMYKYKTLRKTEIPLEVHGVRAGGEHVCAQGHCPGDLGVWSVRLWGHPALPSTWAGGSPFLRQAASTGQHPVTCQGAKKTPSDFSFFVRTPAN